MKICIPDNSLKGIKLTNLGFIDFLKDKHIITQDCQADYDLIFNMSAFQYEKAEAISKKFPNVQIINYVWDYYKFAHEGRHWFNWKPYAEFLKKSKLIIVPSSAQQLRLKELLNLDSVVVKTGHNMFTIEYPSDTGFVLDHMRWYPEENEKWIVNACKELGIPVIHTEHKLQSKEFENTVGACRFLACGYREASTGGLTILEGLWNGKPTLLSNSPYQGGRDYLGDWATYFQYDDFEDCKKKVKEMFENPPKIDIEKARKYITENFSYEIMAENLEREFLKVCSKT